MIQLQVTLISDKGYRPISALVDAPNIQTVVENKKKYQEQGIIKICAKRSLRSYDLAKYGYNQIKMRVYDKEKIEREKAERYEQIKKERGWA